MPFDLVPQRRRFGFISAHILDELIVPQVNHHQEHLELELKFEHQQQQQQQQ
jgi:hypothetical protein